MGVLLGEELAPSWAGRPAHMSPEDLEIWKRWREKALVTLAESIFFDVRLTVTTGEEAEDPRMAKMWRDVTAYRIDVVLRYPKRWYIVELRKDASSSAIGRLLQYKMLWEQEPPDNKPVELILVTDRPAPGLGALAKRNGIELIVS